MAHVAADVAADGLYDNRIDRGEPSHGTVGDNRLVQGFTTVSLQL